MNKRISIVLAVLAATFALGACGGSSEASEATEASPAPTVTVTATKTTEAEPVVQVPAACVEALDLAEEGFSLSADAMDSSSKVILEVPNLIDAILYTDVTEVERITSVVQGESSTMDGYNTDIEKVAESYQSASQECRDAS